MRQKSCTPTLRLWISGEKHTRELCRTRRRRCQRFREIFITALVITPGAWIFWAATNAPPIA